MDIERWSGGGSGVLERPTLLLEACRAGRFGGAIEYPGGKIENALFTYVSGMPDAEFIGAHAELFFGKFLVCMSREWEDFLSSSPYVDAVMRRRIMRPRREMSSKSIRPLPNGYTVSGYDESAFEAHPFGHGKNYADFADFRARASRKRACGRVRSGDASRLRPSRARRSLGRAERGFREYGATPRLRGRAGLRGLAAQARFIGAETDGILEFLGG